MLKLEDCSLEQLKFLNNFYENGEWTLIENDTFRSTFYLIRYLPIHKNWEVLEVSHKLGNSRTCVINNQLLHFVISKNQKEELKEPFVTYDSLKKDSRGPVTKFMDLLENGIVSDKSNCFVIDEHKNTKKVLFTSIKMFLMEKSNYDLKGNNHEHLRIQNLMFDEDSKLLGMNYFDIPKVVTDLIIDLTLASQKGEEWYNKKTKELKDGSLAISKIITKKEKQNAK